MWNENIQNSEFRIDDLAEAMSMSRTVFYRKVKSLMGVSPVDFVKTMRIKRAVQLLEQDELTVSEVGYMSGFTTPQYFSRVFKEAMGCTPKEYKLKHKRGGAKCVTNSHKYCNFHTGILFYILHRIIT